jgi:hypothetical protein
LTVRYALPPAVRLLYWLRRRYRVTRCGCDPLVSGIMVNLFVRSPACVTSADNGVTIVWYDPL